VVQENLGEHIENWWAVYGEKREDHRRGLLNNELGGEYALSNISKKGEEGTRAAQEEGRAKNDGEKRQIATEPSRKKTQIRGLKIVSLGIPWERAEQKIRMAT